MYCERTWWKIINTTDAFFLKQKRSVKMCKYETTDTTDKLATMASGYLPFSLQ